MASLRVAIGVVGRLLARRDASLEGHLLAHRPDLIRKTMSLPSVISSNLIAC
jgi:hypothetical protein